MKTGKAYANKNSAVNRPEGDFYPTPRSLVWTAQQHIQREFPKKESILEPCFGDGSISEPLEAIGYQVEKNDLFRGGVDYLTTPFSQRYVITNPPFSLWDEFVQKAKRESLKVLCIGRLNYFGTASRSQSGIWNHLEYVLPFNRYVDYRTPNRHDGLFHVGAMATAWFLWNMDFTGLPSIEVLDVQPWAKLGNKKD